MTYPDKSPTKEETEAADKKRKTKPKAVSQPQLPPNPRNGAGPEDLLRMNLQEMQKIAADLGIELGGARTESDVRAALRKALEG